MGGTTDVWVEGWMKIGERDGSLLKVNKINAQSDLRPTLRNYCKNCLFNF
jgi:hypothetical protein